MDFDSAENIAIFNGEQPMTDTADWLLLPTQREQFYGVTTGVVSNIEDPLKMGRVKLKLEWLSENVESDWARIASPMAGKNRGIYFIPEVGDEVLVAFEHGHIESPYVLGMLWNREDVPPIESPGKDNNLRFIKSRGGLEIILDDTDKNEKIIIKDLEKKNSIVIDTYEGSITLEGKAIVTIKSESVSIETEKDMMLKSKGDVSISGQNVTIEAKQNYTFKANAQASLEAQSGLEIGRAHV